MLNSSSTHDQQSTMDSQEYETLDAKVHTSEIHQLFNNTTTDRVDRPDKKVTSSASPMRGGGNPSLSPKPVRRRSKASKKTPTKVLNTNSNNFRALVQQYTGCPSRTSGSGTFKGPINWNFSNYRPPQDVSTVSDGIKSSHLHRNTSTSSSTLASASPYGHHQQLSSDFFQVDGFAADGGLVPGQGSAGLGLDTAMILDEGFAAMGNNTESYPW